MSHRAMSAAAVTLFTVAACAAPQQRGVAARATLLDRMLRDKTLTVGYAGYPPYLRREPNTGEISGYSVEIIKAILDPLNVRITWQETTWDNMKQDLLTEKIDLMVEPIFMTIPRAAQLGFTRPYAYFGYGAAVVRKSDNRFVSVTDFNSPKYLLAITQGVTDQEFAERNLPLARLKLIPGNDITITLAEVSAGKVDAALGDVPTIVEYVKAHPEVKALFLTNPPATTPASFATRPSEIEFLNFLNNALLNLEANRFFDALETKYPLPSFRERHEWIAGRGLPK